MSKPRVYIDRMVYNKIMHFVDKSNVEVSGMGKLIKGKGFFRVIDAIMLPQSNTATTTDLTPEGMAKAEFLLKDQKGELNFWWHSHVNMDVFWSGTDMGTIREMGAQGYLLATVFNKKREMRSAVHYENPFNDEALGSSVFLDDLDTYIYDGVTAKHTEAWDAEYDKNIVVPVQRDWRDNWVNRETPGYAANSAKGADDLGNGRTLTKAQKRAARQEEKRAKKLAKRKGNVVDMRMTHKPVSGLATRGITRAALVDSLARPMAMVSPTLRSRVILEKGIEDIPFCHFGTWVRDPATLRDLQAQAKKENA